MRPRVPRELEREFWRLWGPWEPLDPEGVAGLLDGIGIPWWIAGGWAIEAFTGVPRHHEDIDVSYWRDDAPAIRRHLWPDLQCWTVGDRMARPLVDGEGLPDWADQIWVREHAWAPWLMDMPMTRRRDVDGFFSAASCAAASSDP